MRARVISLAGVLGLAVSSVAWAQKVAITDKDCRQLVEHIASQDVNYKPGVDVYGRKVAPADLGGQPQIQAPQNFTFDVNIDLKRFGIPNASPIFQPSVGVGKITVEDGGRRVYFNGQPVGNTEQQALAELCKQRQSAGQPRR